MGFIARRRWDGCYGKPYAVIGGKVSRLECYTGADIDWGWVEKKVGKPGGKPGAGKTR